MDSFLFWVFLIGIIVATLQDLKRREVDNWLNLLLLLISFSYVFFRAIFEKNIFLVSLVTFVLIIMFVVMNLFYYGRVFGGGDAGLLFAMSVFFVGTTFYESVINIGIFILLLIVSGAVYGLAFSFVLYFKNFKKINSQMKKEFGKIKKVALCSVAIGVLFFFFCFFSFVFFLFSIFFFLFPFLYVFARGVEKISMTRDISGEKLREGDWLVRDERVKGKIIKANWEGVSSEEVKMLRSKKKVRIKEGIPFVPAFLVALILYALINLTNIFGI